MIERSEHETIAKDCGETRNCADHDIKNGMAEGRTVQLLTQKFVASTSECIMVGKTGIIGGDFHGTETFLTFSISQ